MKEGDKKIDQVFLSPITRRILEEKLEKLRKERRKMGEEGIPWPHEGPGVHVALQRTEADIFRIEEILSRCTVYNFPQNPEKIELGSGAILTMVGGNSEEKIKLGMVSSIDVSYLPRNSDLVLISPESPLGKALMDKMKGEIFTYKDPEGTLWKVTVGKIFSLSDVFKDE